MRPILAVLTFVAALASNQASAQSQPVAPVETDWRFADPQPALVGGVNVDSLAHSRLVRSLLERVVTQLGQSPDLLPPGLFEKLGQNSITRISFSIADRSGEPAVLVLVEGSLDDATVQGLSQNKMEIRRLDLNRVLLGAGADLDHAVARLEAQQPLLRAGLLQQAQTMALANDLWIAGSLPKMKGAQLPVPVDGLKLALNLQKDLLLDVSVNLGSAKAAQDVIRQLQQSKRSDLEKLGASLNAGAAGSTVNVKFAMNGDSLTKTLGEAFAQGLTPQLAGMLSMAGMAAPAASSQPAAPAPKSAIIYGLDDGPKEVPLGPKP